jgi:putative aldouronate transport system permease protein
MLRMSGASDALLALFTRVVMVLVVVATAYPFVYVASMSISSSSAVLRNEIWLWPVGLSLRSYRIVLSNPEVIQGYANSIFYAAVGGGLSVVATVMGGFALSRRELFGRALFMRLIVFTMFFSGGMIPWFLLVRTLGLYNTRWAIIVPSLVGAWNLIVCRTYFQSTPDSIIESARIDGANDVTILLRVVAPMSKAIIAVLFLYYAVEKWNTYFAALIYLKKASLQPLQIYLMKVVVQEIASVGMGKHPPAEDTMDRAILAKQLRYALIMITITPIMVVYPFLQKYFVQGVLIGALKE